MKNTIKAISLAIAIVIILMLMISASAQNLNRYQHDYNLQLANGLGVDDYDTTILPTFRKSNITSLKSKIEIKQDDILTRLKEKRDFYKDSLIMSKYFVRYLNDSAVANVVRHNSEKAKIFQDSLSIFQYAQNIYENKFDAIDEFIKLEEKSAVKQYAIKPKKK